MNILKKIVHKIRGILKNGDGRKIIENFLSLSLIRVADFILPLIVLPYLITVLGVEKFGLTAFAAALVNYFLNITGAKGISGYGNECNGITSSNLDKAFFNLFKKDENMLDVLEELYQRHYAACKLLDFRLYY